jgi:membrane protease YdiL (CAAX protease family)
MELAGTLLLLFPGVAILVWWLRRRRAGDDPLGPRPQGELPDTTFAVAVAALLWLALHELALPLVAGTDVDRHGGFAAQILLAAGTNVVVALVMLRTATGGTRRPVLPGGKLAAAAVLAAIVVFAAQGVVGLAIDQVYKAAGWTMPAQRVVLEAQNAHGPDLVAAIVGAVVMAPFGEEVFFRGLLLPAAVRFAGERRGLVLQALVFGGIHVVNAWETWPLAIPLAVVGWGAGWLYLRTGSLAVPIVLHAVFNAINFALLRAK